jgi:hypothetical protein
MSYFIAPSPFQGEGGERSEPGEGSPRELTYFYSRPLTPALSKEERKVLKPLQYQSPLRVVLLAKKNMRTSTR